jgi:hypothetical protein
LRPMIHAPRPAMDRAAKSSSTSELSPGAVAPLCVPLKVGVCTSHSCRLSAPTPSGSSRDWRGPAPYPSSEIEKPSTSSRDTSFSGCRLSARSREATDAAQELDGFCAVPSRTVSRVLSVADSLSNSRPRTARSPCSGMVQESKVEGCEHQDDSCVHNKPLPESVFEEQQIDRDDHGCHQDYVKCGG